MTEDEYYTIAELASRLGLTPRTIRYYTSEGLLPPPETRGKYARYGAAHLQRLHEIGRLKAQYLPLSVIRARLEAEGASPTVDRLDPQPRTNVPPGFNPSPSVQLRAPAGAELQAADPFRLTPAPLPMGRVEFFPSNSEPADKADEIDEQSRRPAERWERIVLTPGVELHIRETLSARRRQKLNDLIAAARDILAGEE